MRIIALFLLGSLPISSTLLAQQAPGVTTTPQPLARDVMYRILFNEINAYQDEAAALAA
jgi:hypothetical protein